MPRLPTKADLPDEQIAPTSTPFPDTGAQAIGRGVANVGQALEGVGGNWLEQQDHLDLLRAEGKRSADTEDLVQKFQTDPDYKTFGPRFHAVVSQINANSAAEIRNPQARAAFQAKADYESRGALRRVLQYGTHLQKQDYLATTDDNMRRILTPITTSNDPEFVDARIREATGAADMAGRSGLVEPHQQHQLLEKHLRGSQSLIALMARNRLWSGDHDVALDTLRDLGVGSTDPREHLGTPNYLGGGSPSSGGASASPQSDAGAPGPIAQRYMDAIKRSENEDLFSGKQTQSQAAWDYKQLTNGFGTRARYKGETISREEAHKRANDEIGKAYAAVDEFAPDAPEGVKAALTSLTFNAGDGWTRSGLGKLVREGDYEAARRRFLQYNRAGGRLNAGLMARRLKEAQWFNDTNAEPPANVAEAAPTGTGGRIPADAVGDAARNSGAPPNDAGPVRSDMFAGRMGAGGPKPEDDEDAPPAKDESDEGNKFPAITGPKSSWAKIYNENLSPEARAHLIYNASVALRGHVQQMVNDTIAHAERTGEILKDDNGKSAFDYIDRVLTPNQRTKAKIAIDGAISRHNALLPLGDAAPDDAFAHIAALDPEKQIADAKARGVTPPPYAVADKTQKAAAHFWDERSKLETSDPKQSVLGAPLKGPATQRMVVGEDGSAHFVEEDGAPTGRVVPMAAEVRQAAALINGKQPDLITGVGADGSPAFSPTADAGQLRKSNETLIEAALRAQARRGIPESGQRVVTRAEARKLLDVRDVASMSSADYQDAVEKAMGKANALYGKYAGRALQDAVILTSRAGQTRENALQAAKLMVSGEINPDAMFRAAGNSYAGWFGRGAPTVPSADTLAEEGMAGNRLTATSEGAISPTISSGIGPNQNAEMTIAPPTVGSQVAAPGIVTSSYPTPTQTQIDWIKKRGGESLARTTFDSLFGPGAANRYGAGNGAETPPAGSAR